MWISGINPVREALRSSSLLPSEMLHSRSDPRVQELLSLCTSRGIPVHPQNRETLSSLLGHEHHQGVALFVTDFPYAQLDWILSRPLQEREPLVVLDSIQDPQNLGALMRSACFLGAKGLILPKDRTAKITASVMKVASGAASYLPVAVVTNLVRSLGTLKDAGMWIVGLDVQGTLPLYDVELAMPVGFVIGNELRGLRPLVRRQCDILVRIPAYGPMDSLNAAVAGALALAELQRQRQFTRNTASPRTGPSRHEQG
ncbi:MAG: 23S rRNA (guanosine(2251)-2'-O)-methyltransferase RlmB [Deltaproteobacteria bacterium]|nr:23S rRNA (guanosine(2251)-2'-O)-methyltransferase RlmB [Deltaproteobacteria bacterium]